MADKKLKPAKPVTLHWSGARERLIEHAGKRYWLRPGRPLLVEAETWAAMQAGPLAETLTPLLDERLLEVR